MSYCAPTVGHYGTVAGVHWDNLAAFYSMGHDHYNVNIILADGLIITSPLEME